MSPLLSRLAKGAVLHGRSTYFDLSLTARLVPCQGLTMEGGTAALRVGLSLDSDPEEVEGQFLHPEVDRSLVFFGYVSLGAYKTWRATLRSALAQVSDWPAATGGAWSWEAVPSPRSPRPAAPWKRQGFALQMDLFAGEAPR